MNDYVMLLLIPVFVLAVVAFICAAGTQAESRPPEGSAAEEDDPS